MRRALIPLVLLALLVPAAGAPAREVPKGWLGVSFGPEYVGAHSKLSAELKRMRRSGVESARFAVYWSELQPAAGHAPDYRRLDRIVAAAARARLPLLPVVLGAPAWATLDTSRPVDVPRDPADYAAFVGGLVQRYGRGGTYFKQHKKLPRVPIRAWQIWNEVSNAWYWDDSWKSAYPRLLRAAYDAIKAADPGARVIESGLNTGAGGRSWDVLAALYQQLDAQGLGRPFDEVAGHIYTAKVPDALQVVRETRAVTKRYGDRERPIRVTELAWPAARGKLRDENGNTREFFAATTDKGMAKRLAAGVLLLARERRALGISGVDWFQWASSYKGTDDAFRYSGLRHAARKRLMDKPAMKAFKRVARRLRK
jgi:polysaccharide biosynthesis protein PslG